MRKSMLAKVLLIVPALLLLAGCQGNNATIQPQTIETPTHDNSGLINGWLSTYDHWVNENGMTSFDWSSYQPSTGTALVCYQRQFSDDLYQHTSVGTNIMERFERDRIYRIAIWYGDSVLINNVQNQIPEYAWQYFYLYNNEIISSSKEDFYRSTPVVTCNSIPPTVVPTATPSPTPTVRPTRKSTRKPRPTNTPQPTPIPDYSWHLQFTGINTEQNDNYTQNNNLRVGDTVYFHANLTGGAPYETILPYYEICMNGEFVESSAFSGQFSTGSDIWVRNIPFRYGTLSIRIFYYANNGDGREIDLGSTSVHISARDDNTQTETAKGWISGCDVYFNRYGNLCFDLTNYDSTNKAIIWFSRNESSSNVTQSTVVGGQIVWDSPIPGLIYEYAIWCGDYDYSRDVASLSSIQIPASAWIKLYVTDDRQVIIVSSDVAINIKENE